jgi:hypothetical protein
MKTPVSLTLGVTTLAKRVAPLESFQVTRPGKASGRRSARWGAGLNIEFRLSERRGRLRDIIPLQPGFGECASKAELILVLES